MEGRKTMKTPKFVMKAINKVRPHVPDILIGGGAVLMTGGCIWIGVSSYKLASVVSEHDTRIREIDENTKKNDSDKKPEELEAEQKEAKRKVYLCTIGKVAKLYAPALSMEVVGATGILVGKHILKKQNLALAAAYAALDAGFSRYRQRVIDKYGEDEDKNLYLGVEDTPYIGVNENGEETDAGTEKKAIGAPSGYARYFTKQTSTAWERDLEYCKYFIRLQQEYLNNVLNWKGCVFLNEVYDNLGLKRSPAGQVVGWVYDPERPEGDNYIDLRMTEVYVDDEDHPGYKTKVLMIDPNVDGVIIDHGTKKGLIED